MIVLAWLAAKWFRLRRRLAWSRQERQRSAYIQRRAFINTVDLNPYMKDLQRQWAEQYREER